MGNWATIPIPGKDHPVNVVASGTDSTALSGIVQISQKQRKCTTPVGLPQRVRFYAGGGELLVNWAMAILSNKNHPVAVVDFRRRAPLPSPALFTLHYGGRSTPVLCTASRRASNVGVRVVMDSLGNGASRDTNYPVDVVDENSTPLSGVVQVALGKFPYLCASGARGRCCVLGAWISSGQLGNGDQRQYRPRP